VRLPDIDAWITRQPDNGHALEKCETCDGEGCRHIVYDWHGYPQDGEVACEDCGGEGWIECEPDGLPVRRESTSDRYFRNANRLAA
jgi:hypothetical protein